MSYSKQDLSDYRRERAKEEGQLYNKLFSLRQDADYRDFKDVSEAQIAPLIERVEKLVTKIDGLIRQR